MISILALHRHNHGTFETNKGIGDFGVVVPGHFLVAFESQDLYAQSRSFHNQLPFFDSVGKVFGFCHEQRPWI